jgi:predicted kinase
MLIALAGLQGAGKSTFARALGRSLGAPVLSVDPIEAALFRAGIDRMQPTGLAAYVVAAALAERQIEIGLTTIIDASNYVEPGRQMWRDLAARRGVTLRWIEVVCSDEVVHSARLAARGVDLPDFYAVTWADVERRVAETQAWNDDRLLIDSMAPEETNLSKAMTYIRNE